MAHYLDHAATTPVRPEAAQAAYESMQAHWGNPSSLYAPGTHAAAQLAAHRRDVADAIGARAGEVYFTSGGTESDNWAIFSAVQANRRVGKHIITTAIEHDAVLQPCRALAQQGYEVTTLQPDRDGAVRAEDVARALRPDTALVSMMLVSNELGTILPVAQTAQVLRQTGSRALLHCDAVQALFKVPFSVGALGVDLLSVSGHKIGAPKGIGALYIRDGLRLPALLHGGGQEGGLRSGTEATSQIAAFAAAVRAGSACAQADMAHMREMKAYALQVLQGACPSLVTLAQGDAPHILAISLPGYKSEVVVRFLSDHGVYISSGSACHRGKPSHAYAALKLPRPVLDGALRVSLSRETAQDDLDALAQTLRAAQQQLFTTLS